MGQLIRFDFAELPVRGALVRLDASWQDWWQRFGLDGAERSILGEATAALPLLAANLKFKGRMNLQMQGGQHLPLLVAQIDHQLHLRSMLQTTPETMPGDWATAVAGAQCAVMVDPESGMDRYQAIVAAGGASLARDLEGYFAQSEQLPTRLWLGADPSVAAGLLIQRLPGEAGELDGFETVTTLADTLGDQELLAWHPDDLLRKLFGTLGLRRHDDRPVTLACRCSRERIGTLLLSLGEDDVEALIQEQGKVEAACEFCGQAYVYEADDARALFVAARAEPPSQSKH